MEERDGGVDEKRVARDARPDDPIRGLVEATSREDEEQLSPLVEGCLEQNRNQPQKQRREEESPGPVLALIVARPRHSLVLSFHASEREGGGQILKRLSGI